MPRNLVGFALRARELRRRMDVNFAQAAGEVAARYASARFPLVELGDLAQLIQYGSSTRASSSHEGLPMLRMTNLQEDGLDVSEVKYVSLPSSEVARYRLSPGDVLINRTNGSRDLVGKSEVFREEGEWLFASYLIRLRVDERRALPEFVSAFLNTRAGRMQVQRASRQILMSNINATELRRLVIPLPELEIQQTLVDSLHAARAQRRQLLARADEQIETLGSWIGKTLALPEVTTRTATAFAVRASQLRRTRLDPPAHRSHVRRPHDVPTRALKRVALVNRRAVPTPRQDADLVPYVGLPDCSLTEIQRIGLRPWREVRNRNVMAAGDILIARIEPSVFNKKYVLVETLAPHDYAVTSTEFYVVSPLTEEVARLYLYGIFFTDFVFQQVVGKTTGSSGRRRISRSLFEAIDLPIPPRATQETVSAEVDRRRGAARELRRAAADIWADARSGFEEALLGPEGPAARP